MKGSIRMFVGLLVLFGVAGGMDNSTDAELLALVGIGVMAMLVMASGVNAMTQNRM